jgi:hypothetical protein
MCMVCASKPVRAHGRSIQTARRTWARRPVFEPKTYKEEITSILLLFLPFLCLYVFKTKTQKEILLPFLFI